MYPRSIKMKSLKLFHMNSNMLSKNYSLWLNPLLFKIFPIWVSDCSEQLSVLYFLSLLPCTKQPLWLITFLFITLSWNQKNEKHQKSGQPPRPFSYLGPPISYRAGPAEVFQSHLNLLWFHLQANGWYSAALLLLFGLHSPFKNPSSSPMSWPCPIPFRLAPT